MKLNVNKTVVLIMITMTVIISCGQNHKVETDEKQTKTVTDEHADVIQLSDAELEEFDIELVTAGPGKLEKHVSLPGEIIVPPDNLAHIHPRFAGIVTEVRKHIGDKVQHGDVLAVIESNESLAEYEMKSLIDGTIIEKHFSLGEVVEGKDHGFVVADLSQVWAILKLYQKDLPFVKKGQTVSISAGSNITEATAVINYISPIIDEVTRTAAVRIVLENAKNLWIPGLFVTGSISTSESKVDMIVPKTALEKINNKTIVFIKDDDGFEPREVTVGRVNQIRVEILDGLKAGDVYVSKGGFTLKAELQKSELTGGHGH